ncbi:MAG: 30S ribosomal protein S13 [Verrucomicrobia bacterium]|nr:30S ribosomal protein S13 [Verrucomicrobiota bacterium]
MARLLGVEIPDKKKISISLRYIYGLGPTNSLQILEKAGVDANLRTEKLTDEQLSKIVAVIQQGGYVIEGDLRREIGLNLKRLIGIKSYRGSRHVKGLPVRGQRTQTNARTRKGPRKTVGVVRSKDAKTGKV